LIRAEAENKTFSIHTDPKAGGIITEVDYRPWLHNFANTISRRKELYHKGLGKELNFDTHRRGWLVDRFFNAKDITPDKFLNSTYKELGDFIGQLFTSKGKTLKRKGTVLGERFTVEKKITLAKNGQPQIKYTLTNSGKTKKTFCFGSEFNITMPKAASDDYIYTTHADILKKGRASNATTFGVTDKTDNSGIYLEFDKPANVLWAPVITYSKSERGFDSTYQCSAIMPYWRLTLTPGQTWNSHISVIVRRQT